MESKEKIPNEIRVLNIEYKRRDYNYVKIVIDFLIDEKEIKIDGYLVEDDLFDEINEIIESQTKLTDIQEIIKNGEKTINYYNKDYSFNINFEIPIKGKSDMEKKFDAIDKIIRENE